MAKLDTSAFAVATTRFEASEPREIKVTDASCPSIVTNGVHNVVGSAPSDLPEMGEADTDRYVFRIVGAPRSPSLTILLDTKQLAEQTRVRKINRAIRRAHKR